MIQKHSKNQYLDTKQLHKKSFCLKVILITKT